MNQKDQEGFYYGAMVFYDLASDDVDLILEAEGLHVDLHTPKQCTTAVRKYLDFTPGGPVIRLDEVKAKLAKLKGN